MGGGVEAGPAAGGAQDGFCQSADRALAVRPGDVDDPFQFALRVAHPGEEAFHGIQAELDAGGVESVKALKAGG